MIAGGRADESAGRESPARARTQKNPTFFSEYETSRFFVC